MLALKISTHSFRSATCGPAHRLMMGMAVSGIWFFPAQAQEPVSEAHGIYFQASGQAGVSWGDFSAGYGLGFLAYKDRISLSIGCRHFTYGPRNLPEDYEIKGKPGLVDIHDRMNLHLAGIGFFDETAHDELRLLLAAHVAWGQFDEVVDFLPVNPQYWHQGHPNYTFRRQAGNTGGLHGMGRIEFAGQLVSIGLYCEIYILPQAVAHLGGVAIGIGRQRRYLR